MDDKERSASSYCNFSEPSESMVEERVFQEFAVTDVGAPFLFISLVMDPMS